MSSRLSVTHDSMAADENISELLHDQRIAFVGKLASMAKRDAAQLVRQHGATVLEQARRLGPPDRRRRGGVPAGRDRGPGRLVRRGHAAAGRAGGDRGHHRDAALAAAGTGRGAAGHPPALHAGHAGRVAGRAGGGDSPLAPAGTDRAGARGAAAAVLRFPGGGHGAAAGRAAGGGRLAAGDREAARVAGPLSCPTSPGRWPSSR